MKGTGTGLILPASTLGFDAGAGCRGSGVKYRPILIPGAVATGVEAVNNRGNYVVSYVAAQFVRASREAAIAGVASPPRC